MGGGASSEEFVAAKRVLLIDEDTEVRRILRGGLVLAGYAADDVVDGLSALEVVRRANAEGHGFSCIITEAFLPDFDGKLMLRALRAQYPQLPLIVLSGFGDEELQTFVGEQAPSCYFDKPVDTQVVLAALDNFDLRTTTEQSLAPKEDDAPRVFEAYIFLRLVDKERAGELYSHLRRIPGVRICNAVRDHCDLVLRLTTASMEDLNRSIETVRSVTGVAILSLERIERRRLSPEAEEFLLHYESVSAEDRKQYKVMGDTNAYLFIDIDRYQFERIYTSIIMTKGVIGCQVSSNSSRLTVLLSGAVRPNVVRHLLQKIATMDGIRRVQEATVINMTSAAAV
jgi:CheY-like chemotaxis protein